MTSSSNSNSTITMEEYLQQKIDWMLRLKGQMDGMLFNMPENAVERGFYTWIQGLIQQSLDSYYLIRKIHKHTKQSETETSALLREILGADEYAPMEELRERAKLLGAFYKEIRKKANKDDEGMST